MSDSIAADVLDALYTLLAAEATLAAAVTAGNLVISDGPPVKDFSATTLLSIGAWPIVESEQQPEVTIATDWSSMGRDGALADVDQDIDVPFGIYAMEGNSDDMAAIRRTAITYFAKAASAVRGSTLGLGQVMWCLVRPAAISQTQTTNGAEVVIKANALIRTRI